MTDRPTDKDTAEVVAWWNGHDCLRFNEGVFDDPCHMERVYLDPRDDTDAALELLHWVVNQSNRWGFWWDGKGWVFDSKETGNIRVSIAGEPFRNAVVRLAVEVKNTQNQGTT